MGIGVWVGYPRWYERGRPRAIQYVVVHYTAGSEGPVSAERGATYDKTRPTSISTHAFADSDSVVVEVPDSDRAYHARYHGNEIGVGLELCGTAQTRLQWLDPTSLATLRNGAKWTAEKCHAYGLPVRRLSVAETRQAYYGAAGARPRGIVGHVDCTRAYPEDGGDHTDPGADFPWDVFLAMVAEELAKLDTRTPAPPMEVPDMTPDQEKHLLALAWRAKAILDNSPTVQDGPTKGERNALHDELAAIKAATVPASVNHTHPVTVSATGIIGTAEPLA